MSGQDKNFGRHSRRMQMVSAQQDHIGMLLRQMGADVTQINGLVCFVRFHIGDTELFYVYNLNDDDAYYLQRVKPYPMSAGVFADAAQIADYIQRDVNAFRGATENADFTAYVETNRRLAALIKTLEDAYMGPGLPDAAVERVNECLTALEHLTGKPETPQG